MVPAEVPFWDAVDRIRAADPRYRREAYGFVMVALGVTVQSLPSERRDHPQRRHLSGQELLQGITVLARREFGLMAPTVFREWGFQTAADIGELVFQLVECGQLGARPEDAREDFAGGPDLMSSLIQGLEIGAPPFSGRKPPLGTGSGNPL
jgi:uncharacterized repeat protein (TIGR04138 family)